MNNGEIQMVKRGILRQLYREITSEEKSKWWKALRYRNPNILKEYLNSDKNNEADEEITIAIIEILGQQRFNMLVNKIKDGENIVR